MLDSGSLAQTQTYFSAIVTQAQTGIADVAAVAQNATDIANGQTALNAAANDASAAAAAFVNYGTINLPAVIAGTMTPDQFSAGLQSLLTDYDAKVVARTQAQAALDAANGATQGLAAAVTNDKAALTQTINSLQPYLAQATA